MTIPGVGPVTASAIRATIQDASAFASGREFAAFLGLTPRQNSTGGKTRLGRITKMGDRYLRKLLVVGACATLRHRRGHSDASRLWANGMFERKNTVGDSLPEAHSERQEALPPPRRRSARETLTSADRDTSLGRPRDDDSAQTAVVP
jgi:transposase